MEDEDDNCRLIPNQDQKDIDSKFQLFSHWGRLIGDNIDINWDGKFLSLQTVWGLRLSPKMLRVLPMGMGF